MIQMMTSFAIFHERVGSLLGSIQSMNSFMAEQPGTLVIGQIGGSRDGAAVAQQWRSSGAAVTQ